MSRAYDEAATGGKHAGFLANYRDLPDHLIQKAIRSLTAIAEKHEGWASAPELKLGPDVSPEARRHLLDRWTTEARGFREQTEILRAILQERER